MIFEVKTEKKTYIVDDLKLFGQQTKAFQEAFNNANKENGEGIIIAYFSNAEAILYTQSNRILITLKEIENEND